MPHVPPRHLPRHCAAPAHLGFGGKAWCERPAQMILVYDGGTPAACRACAALFALHHHYFLVLPLPGNEDAKQIGDLQLTGKARSVYLRLLHAIHMEQFRVGDRVPGAAVLASEARCALTTAARALKTMVDEGWLDNPEGEPGRYFVTPLVQWPQPASRADFKEEPDGSSPV